MLFTKTFAQTVYFILGLLSLVTSTTSSDGQRIFKRQANNPANSTILIQTSSEDSQESATLSYEEKLANVTWCGGLMLPKDYNRLVLPVSKRGSTYVKVSLFIRSIMEIDEQNGEITADADLGMRWFDQKIYFFNLDHNWTDLVTNETIANRTYDAEALKCIWKPDIFIDQLLSVDKTSVLSKLVQINFLSKTNSSDSGDITYSARMKLKLRCDMNFVFYPADTQTCLYHIRSYSYTADRLDLAWRGKAFRSVQLFLEDPYDPNFDLQLSEVEPWKKYSEYFIQENFDQYRAGNYSALYFVIKARRRLSYHLVQTYLPSVLLILITWLCFLIPSSMVEARIGISMTTVLTLTAMFAAIRQQSPKVSYTMAIDIWMVFNIFFIFVALSMFTIIYWMKLRLKRKQQVISEREDFDDVSDSELPTVETYQRFVQFTKHYAFWAFAITFVIFFCTYWIWILVSSDYFNWYPPSQFNADVGVDERVGRYSAHGSPISTRIENYEKAFNASQRRFQNATNRMASNESVGDEWLSPDFVSEYEDDIRYQNETLNIARTFLNSANPCVNHPCQFLFVEIITVHLFRMLLKV